MTTGNQISLCADEGAGVHAYKDWAGPLEDGYCTSNVHWVIGEVALWGDVVEHKLGYRAEFGRVHSFLHWGPHVPPPVKELCTSRYIKPS